MRNKLDLADVKDTAHLSLSVRIYANYYAIICSVAPLDPLDKLGPLDSRLIIIFAAMTYDCPWYIPTADDLSSDLERTSSTIVG